MSLKDIRPALRAFLLADSGISSAVGASRIYPVVLPQGVKATSIVYTRISGLSGYHNQGPDNLARPRVQIDAWSTTIPAAAALADLIKARIGGHIGTMGSGGDAVTVQGVFFESEREDYDDSVGMYRVSRDYFIWYEEQ